MDTSTEDADGRGQDGPWAHGQAKTEAWHGRTAPPPLLGRSVGGAKQQRVWRIVQSVAPETRVSGL